MKKNMETYLKYCKALEKNPNKQGSLDNFMSETEAIKQQIQNAISQRLERLTKTRPKGN